MGKNGRNRKFAYVLVGACVLGLASNGSASAGDDSPKILNEDAIEVPRPAKDKQDPTKLEEQTGATVRVVSNEPLVFDIVNDQVTKDGISADTLAVACVVPMDKVGRCPQDSSNVVTLKITLVDPSSKSPAKGTLLVSSSTTGRSDSRAVASSESPKPTQPKKLTVTVSGCASWYDSDLFGCDDDPKAEPLDVVLEPPTGTAVVDGAAGSGVLAVTKAATATKAAEIELTGIDGFGESAGKLGSGEAAWEVKVRRRAPIAFGLMVVLFGSVLAAAVGWLADWARRTADADVAEAEYLLRLGKLQVARAGRREALDALNPGADVPEAWGLGVNDDTSLPKPLSADDARSSTAVQKFKADADAWTAHWSELDTVIDLAHRAGDSDLAGWAMGLIDEGPQHGTKDREPYETKLRLATRAVALFKRLERRPDKELLELLQGAADDDAVRNAVSSRPVMGQRAARVVEGLVTGRRERRVGGGAQPKGSPSLGISLAGLFAAALLVLGLVIEGLAGAVAVAFWMVVVLVLSLGTRGMIRSHRSPLLISALIGAVLAAFFDGADALDASKAWGSPSDIAKSVSASFAVAGTAQILRLGFTKPKLE